MTTEDYEMIYRALKAKRKFNKKLAEVQGRIADMAGDAGQAVGAFAGGVRDEYDFTACINASRQPYQAVAQQFDRCKAVMTVQGDRDRYNDLMAALQGAFSQPNEFLPAFVEPSAEYRRGFPALCQEHIRAIKTEIRNFKSQHSQSGAIGGMASFLGLTSPENRLRGEPRLIEAQVNAAAALESVLKTDWSNVTKWGSIPSGVKRIKALKWGGKASAYLQSAQRIAAASFASRGGRRHDVTHAFYQALSQLVPSRPDSLMRVTRAFDRAKADLAR